MNKTVAWIKLLQTNVYYTNVIYHTKYSWVLVIISIYLFYSSGFLVFFFFGISTSLWFLFLGIKTRDEYNCWIKFKGAIFDYCRLEWWCADLLGYFVIQRVNVNAKGFSRAWLGYHFDLFCQFFDRKINDGLNPLSGANSNQCSSHPACLQTLETSNWKWPRRHYVNIRTMGM